MKTNSVVNKERKDCCGCASCRDICPKAAIVMQSDIEGFLYPKVDENKCVDCGLCKKKCPTEITNLKGDCRVQKSFSGRYREKHKVNQVSSGGLCDAVANYIIDLGGVVYGAGYTDDFHSVIVKRINRKENLNQIRGSKYVQTIKTIGIYNQIKTDIKSGRQVLFIGLPCEVAAVKSHIGNSENLITIEIICSGVPSPEIHKQFACYIETKSKQLITSFNYRKKQYGWHWPYVEVKNGDRIIYNRSWSTMELGYAFMVLVRPSCYNCKFKGKNNVADITAGDFWGLKKNDIRYYKNGVSAIIAHNERAINLVKSLREFELQNATYEEIEAGNPRLYSSPRPRNNREQFSDLFVRKGLIQAYIETLSFKDRLRNFVMTIFSIFNLR